MVKLAKITFTILSIIVRLFKSNYTIFWMSKFMYNVFFLKRKFPFVTIKNGNDHHKHITDLCPMMVNLNDSWNNDDDDE